jgi:putative transposase
MEVNSLNFISQKLQYIHRNPIEAGFVEKADDYKYGSAKIYNNKKGLLEVLYI